MDFEQQTEQAREELKQTLTLGLKSFTSEIEQEIDARVTAALAPMSTRIAELEERVLCLEQVHGMSPADYARPDDDDDV